MTKQRQQSRTGTLSDLLLQVIGPAAIPVDFRFDRESANLRDHIRTSEAIPDALAARGTRAP